MKGIFIAALLAATVTAPAFARSGAATLSDTAATLSPNSYVWQDDASSEPVRVVISLADQRAYVYRGEQLVAVSTVSTGKDGKATPVGSYPVLQKEVSHHSNLYNAAPMPFMQRLTWDGVALHAGNNPGFPASHGCVRMPAAFAKKLYDITQVGTTVDVVDYSVEGLAPADIVAPPSSDQVARAEAERSNAETAKANMVTYASLERR